MMTFLENAPVSAKEMADLREAVGWNRMESCYGNPDMRTYYHISVRDNDSMVGYVACVSDGVTDAYIQNLVVHPAYQGKGIGTELMNRMIAYLREKKIFMISVLYDDSLKAFYSRFGFQEMLCGQMETYECP